MQADMGRTMRKKPMIAVVARMDWHMTWVLLPAMGRMWEDMRIVQDIESPKRLGEGLKRQVLDMITAHEAVEIFVIGSSSTESAQDIMDRVKSLREIEEISGHIPVHGLLFNPETYKLDLVFRGYETES